MYDIPPARRNMWNPFDVYAGEKKKVFSFKTEHSSFSIEWWNTFVIIIEILESRK